MIGEIRADIPERQADKAQKDKLLKEMIGDILSAKTELDSATQNYNFADSDELIDHYAYKIKAAQTRYNMLLKQAKKRGIMHIEYLNNNITSFK